MTNPVCSQNFLLEPRQIVHANSTLSSTDCDQNVLTFKHTHLIKTASSDQLVNFALTTSVQQHKSGVSTNQQVYAPKRGA